VDVFLSLLRPNRNDAEVIQIVASLGRLGNVDADDAVQDALLPALTHVDQIKGRAQMSTWLTTIVINSARTKLRRRLSQVQVALDEPRASRIFP
jgi:DNA-directed RNA polymerase specialized sigma24 family protein